MTTPDTDPEAAETTRLIDETDYEVGQDNIQTQIGPFGLDIHNPVIPQGTVPESRSAEDDDGVSTVATEKDLLIDQDT